MPGSAARPSTRTVCTRPGGKMGSSPYLDDHDQNTPQAHAPHRDATCALRCRPGPDRLGPAQRSRGDRAMHHAALPRRLHRGLPVLMAREAYRPEAYQATTARGLCGICKVRPRGAFAACSKCRGVTSQANTTRRTAQRSAGLCQWGCCPELSHGATYCMTHATKRNRQGSRAPVPSEKHRKLPALTYQDRQRYALSPLHSASAGPPAQHRPSGT